MFMKLPNDLQKEIATYLDTYSLCFFARTSHRSLRNVRELLLKHQQALLCSPTFILRARGYHSLCYTSNAVYACGNNNYGQLGLGHNKDCTTLSQWDNDKWSPGKILQVVVGDDHILVLTEQGLYACGYNNYGQLGLGHTKHCPTLTPLDKDKLPPGKILQVVAGSCHTLVLTEQGLYACGYNRFGQLGLGHINDCTTFIPLYKDKWPLGKILQVVAGNFYTLVLTDQGLYECGRNDNGQLGLGGTNLCTTLTPLDKNKLPPGKILQVVAGGYHTLVLTEKGLYECGYNRYGQLGLGHINDCTTFTPVDKDKLPPGKILQVAAGGCHTLVLTEKGLYACGCNDKGQLGLGHTKDCATFTPLDKDKLPPGKILQVAAGGYHTLVLTEKGLYACGENRYGQLSLGHINDCTTLMPVTTIPAELRQLLSLYRHLGQLITLSQAKDPVSPSAEPKTISGFSPL